MTLPVRVQAHVERFIDLGADPQTTKALGSVKYDVTLPQEFAQRVTYWRTQFALQDQLVWIAASTHPGEDALVLEAFQTHPAASASNDSAAGAQASGTH